MGGPQRKTLLIKRCIGGAPKRCCVHKAENCEPYSWWKTRLLPVNLLSNPSPRIPSCISTPFPGIWQTIMENARSGLDKYGDDGESHCARPCPQFTSEGVRAAPQKNKTSCQVWNSESAECWGGVFADRLLVPPRPTPTPSLWCLCAFVNEEILVPWWDIAVSWVDSASSLPSAPRTVTQPSRNPIGPLSSQLVEVLKVEHIHLIHLKYSLNWHKCEILMQKWVDSIICWPPFIDNWSLTLTAFNFKLNVVTTNVSLNTNHISNTSQTLSI